MKLKKKNAYQLYYYLLEHQLIEQVLHTEQTIRHLNGNYAMVVSLLHVFRPQVYYILRLYPNNIRLLLMSLSLRGVSVDKRKCL